jgi:hypothetical protein
MTGFVSPVKAAGGAYLVDDASITPAGHCQLESWIQALWRSVSLGDQSCLQHGAGRMDVGCCSARTPFSAPGSACRQLDAARPGQAFWDLALQANVTYSNGHVLTQSNYAAATFALDAAKRWSLNTEVGELRRQGSTWKPLAGVGIEFKVISNVTLLAEHLRSSQGPSVSQAGIRWLLGGNSIDLVAGHTSFEEHNNWLTLWQTSVWLS